jgi:hypothetical protein
MKLSEIKSLLPTLNDVVFRLENGTFVPEHFHVTEVGMITKRFIDCGGTLRTEKAVNFQLWYDKDTEHKLKPSKLLRIIEFSEKQIGLEESNIEVEYQGETIGKYSLDFDGTHFILKNTVTTCLASDKCGIPQKKQKIQLSDLHILNQTDCNPDSDCC